MENLEGDKRAKRRLLARQKYAMNKYLCGRTTPLVDNGCDNTASGTDVPVHQQEDFIVDHGTLSSNVRGPQSIAVDMSLDSMPREAYILERVPSCSYCKAKRFYREPKSFCCLEGKIKLAPSISPPELVYLLTSDEPDPVSFRTFIRTYNNNFAFTSIGVTYDKDLCKRNKGVYTFRVQGQIYHYIDQLFPSNTSPSFLQLYFYDTEHEMENRLVQSDRLNPSIVAILMSMLKENPYSIFLRSLASIPDLEKQTISIRSNPGLDQRVYNTPSASQVAAIWPESDESDIATHRDIIVHTHQDRKHRVNYFFGCYDPLQYPILFPQGESGWHTGIRRTETSSGSGLCLNEQIVDVHTVKSIEEVIAAESEVLDDNRKRKRLNVSAREYYCYKFQMREDTSLLLRSGRLLQQFVVDIYVKLESSRLDFLRLNQKLIRAELYEGLVDGITQGETRGDAVGHRVILPASFIGGPRDMCRRFSDAMALVQKLGKPDLFITMTCNPSWPEIKEHLSKGEEAQNRPDLVARVFRAKLEELKNDLFKREIFGPVAGYVYVIEFQKRGLPHVHFLIILKKNAKIISPAAYDAYVSAEIPPKSNPHLRGAVHRHMMHGPCGTLNPENVCMKNKECKHHYPKPFCENTRQDKNSYPIYRRRQNCEKLQVRGHDLDNRWVIPYNPYLLAKYDCHINVEICSTIKAVKYIYKYIYKGHDRVVFGFVSHESSHNDDEIDRFQSGRWISPPEAMWRIYSFNMNEMIPNVVSLQLHLENKQTICFKPSDSLEVIARNKFLQRTMLTEFFVMNQRSEASRQILYKDYPEHYVWNKKDRMWTPRKQGTAIGRVVTVNPAEGERFYLRLLLNHVRGPTSFSDLLIVDQYNEKEIASTFRESALLRGLLHCDNTLENCLSEAANFQMPSSLRRLFATILVYCSPTDPKKLFHQFLGPMSEDFTEMSSNNKNSIKMLVLRSVDATLESMGRKLDDYHITQETVSLTSVELATREITEELSIPVSQSDLLASSILNHEQAIAYNRILSCVNSRQLGLFLVDGPGGTGKTFLYRALLATIRSSNRIALAVATSGVAASILPGGRTAHSRFKIPIDVDESLTCNISKQSGLASLLRVTELIIWDEASMANRRAIEAFNRMLQDLLSSDSLFGGKVVVFGGDFRQVLPVVPRSSIEETKDASLVKSPLWPHFEVLSLHENMRARTDLEFSEFLLRVGNGAEATVNGNEIRIPNNILLNNCDDEVDIQNLIDFIFPNIATSFGERDFVINRAILSPKNDHVDELNQILIDKFPGQVRNYFSRDESISDEGIMFDEEFMNQLTPNGYPPYRLSLKINCPIVLLRNIDPSKGLSNGTRLICRRFERNVIDAEIAIGHHTGNRVFIPRIPILPNKTEKYPFPFKRTQFPVRLCFAMTINKAQGQTLEKVGIYLLQPVFSHGQLYVALSRATKASNLKVLIRPSFKGANNGDCTSNIVYEEILRLAHSGSVTAS